jgi:hypothetical protein
MNTYTPTVHKFTAFLLLSSLLTAPALSQGTCQGCNTNSIADIGNPGTQIFPCNITMQFSGAGVGGECVQEGASCNDDLVPCKFTYFFSVNFGGNPGDLEAGFRVSDADDKNNPTHQAEGYNEVPVPAGTMPIAGEGSYSLYCGSTGNASLIFTPSNDCEQAKVSIKLACYACLYVLGNPN